MAYRDPEKQREYAREYRKRNHEKRREAKREWRKANREKDRKTGREWYKRNSEKVRKTKREWAKRNPEKVRKTQHECVKRNPETIRESCLKSNREARGSLKDRYVRTLLSDRTQVKDSQWPPDIVELKRAHVMLTREIKRIQKQGRE